jgi:hypothetical protein
MRLSDEPARAGIANLLRMYQALSGQSQQWIEAHFAGKGYGALKSEVAEQVVTTLCPIQQRYDTLKTIRERLMCFCNKGLKQPERGQHRCSSTLKNVLVCLSASRLLFYMPFASLTPSLGPLFYNASRACSTTSVSAGWIYMTCAISSTV